MELSLKEKVAIVTGANRGIGAGVARQLALDGMNVALVARDWDRLDRTADDIRQSTDRKATTLRCDLKAPGSAAAVTEQTFSAFGRVDPLVNDAGAIRRGDIFDMTFEDWQDGLALKLHRYVRMTRVAWPRLVEVRGTIVNIVGIGAWTGMRSYVPGDETTGPCSSFFAAGRASPSLWKSAIGRRATDARDRPRADDQPDAVIARRTDGGLVPILVE